MSVERRMQAAYAAFSKGDFASARIQGQAALKARPKDASILQFLGVTFCQSGDPQSGADYLRMALSNGGESEDNRINLAKALAELGQFDEALAACAPGGVASTPDLQRMHADILKMQGRSSEAIWAYEKLVYEQPDNFDGWNNLGNARHETGDLDGALDAFRKARSLNPDSSLIHINIARVLLSKDQYEDACLMLEKAALLAPEDPAPLIELGRTLTNIDHAEAGLRALGTAARLNPKDPRVFVAIGLAFNDLSEQLQAERAFKFAVQADPKHPAGYLNLGILLEKANRLQELEALVEQALQAGVEGDEVSYLRALLSSRKGAIEQALAFAQSIQSPAIHPATLAQFIGQLSDKLGQIDRAFESYEEMNRLMAQTPLGMTKDRSAYQRGIDSMNAKTTAQWVASWQRVSATDSRASPAFLIGFPRSGTTLLDTVIMGHSGVHVLEEIPLIEKVSNTAGEFSRIAEMDEADVAELRALYFTELDKASPPRPGKLVIDKNPLSMIRMPLIHRLFPDAKIILSMRHPCDVVLSCYMQNFKPTEAMSSFLDLTNAGRTYDRIFSYWEKCREVLPLDVHMLRYEAMVEDVEAAVRPLFDFLDLPWEEQVLDHQKTAAERGYIRTPSYAQVTERIYSSASGRWKRYETQMKEVLPILEPWVARYGYSMD
jgi:tetratricopeptide (TPR) repeat protein